MKKGPHHDFDSEEYKNNIRMDDEINKFVSCITFLRVAFFYLI